MLVYSLTSSAPLSTQFINAINLISDTPNSSNAYVRMYVRVGLCMQEQKFTFPVLVVRYCCCLSIHLIFFFVIIFPIMDFLLSFVVLALLLGHCFPQTIFFFIHLMKFTFAFEILTLVMLLKSRSLFYRCGKFYTSLKKKK